MVTMQPSLEIRNILARRHYGPLLAVNQDKMPSDTECHERESWSGLRLPFTVQSSSVDVEVAVATASKAFCRGSWRSLSRRERGIALLKWASLIEQDANRLAYVNCLETGRSIKSLVNDSLPKAVEVLRWFAELIDKIDDRSVHSGKYGNDFALVRQEAIGVVCAILPWNDPMVTLIWKVAPALLMGNAVIVKPSEYATLVVGEALLLAHKAGIPYEFLQMLTGDGGVGSMLVKHPTVAKVAFTGSSITASKIGLNAYSTGLKRLSFECGGKGSFIFGKGGRNPECFAQVVVDNMFYNQGQICSAPSVLHIPHDQLEQISEYISIAAKAYMPRHPMSDSKVGYMVSTAAVAKIQMELNKLDRNNFVGELKDAENPLWSISPTILKGLKDNHHFWDTELFAPVLLIRPYQDIEEAIEMANASKYGLAGGIWSHDIDECMDVADQLRVGNVHINSWGDDPNQVPFGGVKESGHGREKSIDALEGYSQLKSIFYHPRRKV